MIAVDLQQTLQKLTTATTPEAVFGDLSEPLTSALSRSYRHLARCVHPDHNQHAIGEAEAAFKLLQQWHLQAEQKVANGTYGQLLTIDLELPDGTKIQSVESPLSGDLSSLYVVRNHIDLLFKLAHHPHNSDLFDAEAKSLQLINRELRGVWFRADPGRPPADPLHAHFPYFCEALTIRDEAGAARRANLMRFESGYVSLAQVIRRYPRGVHPADAAWMFNRLLAALGKTHELGLVHGAVVAEHVLIRPKDHNGMLIDWCYSVENGETIKAISPPNKISYAPEVVQKRPATAATDLYMAAKLMTRLLGGDPASNVLPPSVPKPIASLLRSCLLPSQHYRASSAWELFDEFQEILRRLYGKPTFRPFKM